MIIPCMYVSIIVAVSLPPPSMSVECFLVSRCLYHVYRRRIDLQRCEPVTHTENRYRIVLHASTFQQHFWFCLCCEIYSATTKTTFLSIMLTFYFLQYVNFMHAWNTGMTYCIWQNFAVYNQRMLHGILYPIMLCT